MTCPRQKIIAERRPRNLAIASACLILVSPACSWQIQPSLRRQIVRHPPRISRSARNQPHRLFRKEVDNSQRLNAIPAARISVALDRPLISDAILSQGPPRAKNFFQPALWVKSISTLFSNTSVIQMAVVTFVAALIVSLAVKQSGNIIESIKTAFKMMNGRVQRVLDKISVVEEGVPMPFDESEGEGWGVCTLQSKKRLGKSSFMQYEFNLPRADYVLPLDLGQTLSLCVLDRDDNVAKGDFFPFYLRANPEPGSFSILAPNYSTQDDNEYAMGHDAANLCRVLQHETRAGDEIAIKPGPNRLSYRGQFLPVTDMVFVACGVGIVPVLDQVRSVLPNGSSSVKSVTVLWLNDITKDFDVTSEMLEKEYFKYSTKLAVSCVVDDMRMHSMAQNSEINAAIPDFIPGTMAVIAAPKGIAKKAINYLEDRGYPKDTICML